MESFSSYSASTDSVWVIGTAGWCPACSSLLQVGFTYTNGSPVYSDFAISPITLAATGDPEKLKLMLVLGDNPSFAKPSLNYCKQYGRKYARALGLDEETVLSMLFMDHDGVDGFPVLFSHIESYGVEGLSLPWSGFIDSRADEPVYLYADEATYETYTGSTATLPRRRLVDLVMEYTGYNDGEGGEAGDGAGGEAGDGAGGDGGDGGDGAGGTGGDGGDGAGGTGGDGGDGAGGTGGDGGDGAGGTGGDGGDGTGGDGAGGCRWYWWRWRRWRGGGAMAAMVPVEAAMAVVALVPVVLVAMAAMARVVLVVMAAMVPVAKPAMAWVALVPVVLVAMAAMARVVLVAMVPVVQLVQVALVVIKVLNWNDSVPTR